ncbi:MAG: tripartite tricarboxylate transporter TctB family protein [Chloroflexales bacterium]|nr:tripartite tricarboxylate transporter TctB family protein [Chloroflexales bacterium]
MHIMRLVAIAIFMFGIAYLAVAFDIEVSATYATIGPRFFPVAIGIGMVLSGVWLFATPKQVLEADSEQMIALDWPRFGGLLAIMIGYITLLQPLGYIITTTMLMLGGSQLLGERQHLRRDAIVAVLLAVVTGFVFARLLGITLPEGLIGW